MAGAWLTLVLILQCCHLVTLQEDGSMKEVEHRIPEELPVGTVISDLRDTAKLRQKYDDATVAMLQFDFLTPKGTYESYLQIDHNTGVYKIGRKMDREIICPYLKNCVITVDVVIQPFQYFQIVKLRFTILDMNDNSPTFPKTDYHLTISEGAVVGGTFPLPAADDPDSPRNGVQDYRLNAKTNKFVLKVIKNEAEEMRLQLVLKAKLNREEEDSYQLRIMAEDGGVPPKKGLLLVTVTVGDLNDNEPRFYNSTYRVSVSENAPVNSVIVQVHAYDPDLGPNGRLVYKFSQKSLSSYGTTFGVNNHTGQIYLKKPLDYEVKKSYHLSMMAHDQSKDPYYGYCDVIIYVQDVNDNAPEIRVKSFTSSGSARVSEWAKKGTFVAHVAIRDVDSGNNGEFSCNVGQKSFELVPLYHNHEYKLLTAGTFDRETKAIYNVTLECRDRGTPQLYSVTSFMVMILDKNDNYPKFVNLPYKAEVLENNDISAEIIQVTAKDRDLGSNGHVKYKIEKNSAKYVSINEDTGRITARAVFDYEQSTILQFPVFAYDQGIPAKTSTATVTLSVVNVNDETPIFTSTKYMFGVIENQPVNTLVGQLTATDADKPPFSKLYYNLSSNKDGDSFYINPNTGSIKTRRMLDRESQDTYYLTAIVSDRGHPPLSGTVSVTIHVEDVNDNVPIVDFPNPANRSVRVSGDIPVGYEITQITAHDDDLKGNRKLSFYIIDQSEPEMVTIDPWTGVITANKIPTFEEDHKTVFLKIQVKDNGNPQQSVETKLEIIMDKSIPFVPQQEPILDSIFSESNAFIWILSGVISLSLVVIVVLVIAIFCVRRRRLHNRLARYGYYGAAKMEVKTGSLGHDRVWKFESQDRPVYMNSPSKPHAQRTGLVSQGIQGDNSAILYYQMQNQANAASSLAWENPQQQQRGESDYQELGPPERLSERTATTGNTRSPSRLKYDPQTGIYTLSTEATIQQRDHQVASPPSSDRKPLERQGSTYHSTLDSGVDDLNMYAALDRTPDSEAGTLYQNLNIPCKRHTIRTNPKVVRSPTAAPCSPMSPQSKMAYLKGKVRDGNAVDYHGSRDGEDPYMEIINNPMDVESDEDRAPFKPRPHCSGHKVVQNVHNMPPGKSMSDGEFSSSLEDYKFNSDGDEEYLGYVSDVGDVENSSPSLAHSVDV